MGSDEAQRIGGGSHVNGKPESDPVIRERGSESEKSSLSDVDFCDATKMSSMRKIHVLIAGFTCTFNGNFGSSMPSGALDAIAEHFHVTNRVHLILLNSLYMVGYVLGPLIFGPMSEWLGRRPVLIGTYVGYLIFMLACAGAPNYAAMLVFRLLCGINAAAPTTIIGGLYADIFDDPSTRGNAMVLYMCVTTFGPLVGPIVSGFSSTISWRWPFWISGIMAGVGLPLVLTLPETFAPVLRNKAAAKHLKRNKETGVTDQVQIQPFNIRKIFFRPMKLLFTEVIVSSTSAYLALAYSVFYLLFQAYPIVFQKFYGLSPGMAGLAYIPLAIGNILSFCAGIGYTWYHDRQTKAGAEWTKNYIYRRLPLACIASPCMVVALFWLGWTVWPSTSPIIPSMSGILFCFGFNLLFMGMVNYLTDVYREYSASVLGAAGMTRSIGAVLLPLSAERMYGELGVHWAPSVLGFIALAMGVIPFIFIKYGDRLARSSKMAREAFQIQD